MPDIRHRARSGTPSNPDRRTHFDPAPLLESIDHDFAAFAELAAMFRHSASGQLAALAAALENQDRSAAREIAHGLKGSLALFAARSAIDVLSALEEDCRQGTAFPVERRLGEVCEVVNAVNAGLLDCCAAHGVPLADDIPPAGAAIP